MLHDQRANLRPGWRAAATASPDASAARRTCPAAGPTAATAAAAATSCCVCDDSLRDLQGFRRRAHYRRRAGGHGEGALRHGADGEHARVVRVPPGTAVDALEDGTRYDLVAPGPAARRRARRRRRAGQQALRGRRRARRRGWPSAGCPGEEGWIELRLKLLADVGLVGLPNAGQVLAARALTRARRRSPTTRSRRSSRCWGRSSAEERQLVLADIPGLIEGASDGAGLGHDFLAHVERTRLLVHVLDLAPLDGSDPAANHATIEARARRARPAPGRACRASSRCPRPTSCRRRRRTAAARAVARAARARTSPVLVTSSATGAGLDELARAAAPRAGGRAAEPEAAGEDARRAPRVPPRGAARRSASSAPATAASA